MDPDKYEEIKMQKNLQDLYDALLEKSDELEAKLAKTEDELAIVEHQRDSLEASFKEKVQSIVAEEKGRLFQMVKI